MTQRKGYLVTYGMYDKSICILTGTAELAEQYINTVTFPTEHSPTDDSPNYHIIRVTDQFHHVIDIFGSDYGPYTEKEIEYFRREYFNIEEHALHENLPEER